MLTKEEISKKIINEIKEGMEGVCDINTPEFVDIDMVNQTITLKFTYNHVVSDDYIGLANY